MYRTAITNKRLVCIVRGSPSLPSGKPARTIHGLVPAMMASASGVVHLTSSIEDQPPAVRHEISLLKGAPAQSRRSSASYEHQPIRNVPMSVRRARAPSGRKLTPVYLCHL
jgi:hypothetical protein